MAVNSNCLDLREFRFVGLVFLSFLIHVNSWRLTYVSYPYRSCSVANFTANSTYHFNRNLLLSSLSSNAPGINGFFNTSVGRSPNDTIYGLFQCRGDLGDDDCRTCVAEATRDIARLYCPSNRGAVIWYDECIFRYLDQPFSSVVSTQPTLFLINPADLDGDVVIYTLQVIMSVLNSTASKAAASKGALFSSETVNSGDQSVYTLTQCTGDLSNLSCRQCLNLAIQQIPRYWLGKKGGRILYPSCYIRYEVYPFFATPTHPRPSPPSPPPKKRSSTVLIPSPPSPPPKKRSSTVLIVAIVGTITIVILLVVGWYFLCRVTKKKHNHALLKQSNAADEISTVESLQFDFNTIDAATNNFSEANKLGRGGFGEVYKGTLANGQEIAVKRLSKGSSQGSQEFKNEVLVVAKLQHRNLVTLLGFCMEDEEKILIYEFISNKSLDYFLFDPKRRVELDWSRRYKILNGIARGILYLHEDSRLRVIHRDLKASNILLDGNFNAKISDFGLARIIQVDQAQESTCRIVGTYGYMSPEYAMHGHFSMKSDVYSFGVMMLEIISGKRNSDFYRSDLGVNILTYAWSLWQKGTPLELLDQNLKDSYSSSEVERCIHIGLLSVQEDPSERPSMTSIIHMLTNYSATLPLPNHPAFISKKENMLIEAPASQSGHVLLSCSANEITATQLCPR